MEDKYNKIDFNITIERFLKKILIIKNGCWEFLYHFNQNGYGIFYFKNQTYLAHRFLYCYFNNGINNNLTLDHLCRNRACVNPNHLEQVTHRKNMIRGNCQSIVNANKMECIRGHPFDFSNTYINPCDGARQCRICRYDYNKKRQLLVVI